MKHFAWTICLSCLLLLSSSSSHAQFTDCNDIQNYNAITGAPESPYDGAYVYVQGELHATAFTFDRMTFFIQDATGGLRLEAPGWAFLFAEGDTVQAEGVVSATAAGEIKLDVWDMWSVGSGTENDPIATALGNIVNPFDYDKVGWFLSTEGYVSEVGENHFSIEDVSGDSLRIDVDPETDIDTSIFAISDYCRVTGFCTNVGGELRVMPRRHRDLIQNPLGDEPPVITDVNADNWFPLDSDPITITAVITDSTAVTSATLYYRDNCQGCTTGAYTAVTMFNVSGDIYSAVIPAIHTLAQVDFYVEADDDVNTPTRSPGGAPTLFYSLAIGFVSIANIQYVDPMELDQSSPAIGSPLSIGGLVTVPTIYDAAGHAQCVIQQYELDGETPYDPRWQAITIDQGGLSTYSFDEGDEIRAFGFVDENLGLTRFKIASDEHLQVVDSGVATPAPIYATLDTLSDGIADDENGAQGEAYESVRVRTKVCTVMVDNGTDIWVTDASGAAIWIRPLDDVDHATMTYGTLAVFEGYLNCSAYIFEIVPTENDHIVTGMSAVGDDGLVARSAGRFTSIAPNPFNPATEIRFVLQRDADVRLEIFDVRGRLVHALFAGPLDAREHSMTWNGCEANGCAVSSGIYFARLSIGGEVAEVRAVSLVK